MVEPGNEMQKFEDGQIDWAVADTSLLKFSVCYLVVQLAIIWIGNFIFSSNVEISRLVYSFFAALGDVTPALVRLKVGYAAPINSREFSQVFAIYFLLLVFLSLYLIGLCGLLFSRKFRSLPWRKMITSKYAIFLPFFPFGCWSIYSFYAGPSGSLRNYLGIFGMGFIDSECIQLPVGQFLILCSLGFYYAIGKASKVG
jgi:hypothetical protein